MTSSKDDNTWGLQKEVPKGQLLEEPPVVIVQVEYRAGELKSKLASLQMFEEEPISLNVLEEQ